MSIKIKIVSLIVMVLLVITTRSYGVDAGKITGDNVRLRKEPNLQASLIKLLSINDKVEVLGQEGDWYKIVSDGDTGYVFKDYIKVTNQENHSDNTNTENNTNTTLNNNITANTITNSNTVNNVNTNNTASVQEEQNQKINTATLPIEATVAEETAISILPLINSSDIAIITADTKVTVTEYKNGWTYILSGIANGWIREEKLKGNNIEQNPVEQEPDNQPEPTEEDKEQDDDRNNKTQNNISNKIQTNITNTNTTNNTSNKNNASNSSTTTTSTVGYATTSVNVRKSANSESEIIDGLVKNDKVTILGEEGGWYKVKVNGLTGYIGKKYISNEKFSTSRSLLEERDDVTTTILKGKEIVDYAKQFLGYKYILGGTMPSKGFDCSGFTYYVYKNFGYDINRTSSSQTNNGTEVNKNELQLGDLVFFSQGSKTVGHVGIYIGDNKFIHAANAKRGIVITELSNSYYKQNYVTARRIIK